MYASNSRVNLLSSLAHGTGTTLTPHLLHLIRGTRACMYASCWKKFRCLQDFGTVSWTGFSGWPQSGQENRLPLVKSRWLSIRFWLTSNWQSTTFQRGCQHQRSLDKFYVFHSPKLTWVTWIFNRLTHLRQRGAKNYFHAVSFRPIRISSSMMRHHQINDCSCRNWLA